MKCCKVGCTNKPDISTCEEISFDTDNGLIIITKIYWCEKHKPCKEEKKKCSDCYPNIG